MIIVTFDLCYFSVELHSTMLNRKDIKSNQIFPDTRLLRFGVIQRV